MMLTVFTPIYNCKKYLERSYKCLNDQTYSNWEWVVVDDGSTDDSKYFFDELIKKDHRVKYYRFESNKGRGAARAKALELGQVDNVYVVWDVDDLYLSNRLEKIYLAFLDGDIDYFSSSCLVVTNDLNLKGARNVISNKGEKASMFTHPSMAFSYKVAQSKPYDTAMRAGEDLALMILLREGGRGYFSPDYLMLYVEDREVNLEKAIVANLNQYKTLKKLIKNGVYKIGIRERFKYEFKMLMKFILLFALKLKPGLYIRTVSMRDISYINTEFLTKELVEFIKKFRQSEYRVE